MIVDTSAILAIALAEPERNLFLGTIADAGSTSMSAGNWLELGTVLVRRGLLREARLIRRLIDEANIQVLPVTEEQAEIGRQAYAEYGQGTGQGARLNFGDCFAYALAKAKGEPLLFKGDDFAKTDIAPAL